VSMFKDLVLVQGKTFTLALRWEVPPVVYRAISAMPQTAPVRFTVPGHGIPDGWRAALSGIKGPIELNAPDPNNLRDEDYHQVTVIDANTVEFNGLNAAGLRSYVSGGFIQYNTPKDLTGFTARMSVKRTLGTENLLVCTLDGVSGDVKPEAAGTDGTVEWAETTAGTPEYEWRAGHSYSAGNVIDFEELLRLSTANGRILINETLYTITLIMSAADTAGIDWRSGTYDLELVSPDVEPIVTRLLYGRVRRVEKEATTQ